MSRIQLAPSLILPENPGQGGSLNHPGVEVADTDAVDAEQARLAEAGLIAVEERDTTCRYARQDKFWVQGTPGGSGGRSTRYWRTARRLLRVTCCSSAPTMPAARRWPPRCSTSRQPGGSG